MSFSYFKIISMFLFQCFIFHSIANNISDERNEIIRLIKNGANNLSKYNLDSSVVYFKKAAELSVILQDSVLIVACYNNLGLSYIEMSDYKESVSYFQKAYQFQSNLNSTESMNNLLNLMVVYRKMGALPKAVDIGTKLLSKFDHKQNTKSMASCFNEFGIINKIQKKYDQAIEFYKKSLDIRRENHNFKGIVGSLNNIGNTYKEKGKYKKALKYFNEALELKMINGSLKSLGTAYMNIADLQIRLKKYYDAENNLLKALEYKEKINDKSGIVATCDLFAWLYTEMKLYEKAEEYVHRAKKIAEEISSLDLQKETYLRLKNLYAAQNKGQKALYYYDKYIAVKDSIFNTESMKHMQEMETRYQTREKEQQIKLLHLENSNQELLLQKTRLGNWLLAGFALLLLLSILPVYYFIKQKQNYRLLQERSMAENKECNRISRELHDGVVSNLSYLCRWGEDEQVNGHFIQKLRKVSEEIRGISHQLNVNAIGKLAFRESLIDSLDLEHFPKDIDLKIYLPDDFEVEKYDEKMNWIRIIKELLNNSLKYADASIIQIQFLQTGKSIHFQYQDNGRGVDLQKVKPGNGMQNIEDRVKLLTGKMEMNSELGEGFECVITV